eukprot:6527179-Pyramimonas_sp.AAC.1
MQSEGMRVSYSSGETYTQLITNISGAGLRYAGEKPVASSTAQNEVGLTCASTTSFARSASLFC